MSKSKRKRTLLVLFILYFAVIVWLTLAREPHDHRIFRNEVLWAIRGWVSGESWGKQETIYWFENFLLFIPFGLLFPKQKSWKCVAITTAVFSIIIEMSQFIFVLGECELDDVIANVIGALIGYFLFIALKKIFYWGERRV